MSGCQYISNPFQVLGKSGPSASSTLPTPTDAKPVTSANAPPMPASAGIGGKGTVLNAPNVSGNPVTPTPPIPMPEKPSHSHLTFLHHLGSFLLDDVLPTVLQVAIPILERKI